jgi:hypothetical protein
VRARKFRSPVRREREVGILGRPHPTERLSGDDAVFFREGAMLRLALADGLGHGPLARQASSAAVAATRLVSGVEAAMSASHQAAAGTRGAVMAVAALNLRSEAVSVACVGNVTVDVVGPKRNERFGGVSFVLGQREPSRRVRTEEATLGPWEALVMFTDGISSRASLQGESELLRAHPLVMAHHLLSRFYGGNDDALVLVVR